MDARECGRLNSFASIGRSDPAAMILALLRVLSSDARAYRLASAEQRACWQSQHLNARVPAFGQIRSIERERPRAFPAASCVLGGTVRTRLLSMTGSGIGDPPSSGSTARAIATVQWRRGEAPKAVARLTLARNCWEHLSHILPVLQNIDSGATGCSRTPALEAVRIYRDPRASSFLIV